MRIGVTGLSSDIGRAVLAQALLDGHIVEGMGRRPEYRTFDLKRHENPSCIDGLDGVIHLAWDRESKSSRSLYMDYNVKASTELFAACARSGIPAVLLSSSSAGQPKKSRYGAAKLATEQAAAKCGFPSLRAGLIWGGELSPVMRTLQHLATLPGILPLPSPGMVLDHNHRSHVAAALLRSLVMDGGSDHVCSVASPEFVTSTEVLEALRGSRWAIEARIPARFVARTAQILIGSGILSSSRLDSAALLDTTADVLEFDPDYPDGLGRLEFLSWVKK